MTAEARSTPRAHHPRQPPRMRLFVSGGTGVLGRGLRPLAATAGHELVLPTHDQFDLFDPTAVAAAIRDADGVLHLATRIRARAAREPLIDRTCRASAGTPDSEGIGGAGRNGSFRPETNP
jgi:uncharacterized protein YbjT (DUF2867 family)